MKKFQVNFSYEMQGTIEVEAKSQKEAEKKLLNDLDYYGLSGLHEVNKSYIDHAYREFDII